MAPSTRSIRSTNVSSSSEANTLRPRIEPGWRRTISLGPPRRGTTPSSKTKACQPGVVSASSAPYVSGRRCVARGCRSSPGCRSSLRCTTTPSASTRCCAMHTTSRHPRRRSSLWEDCPTTPSASTPSSARGLRGFLGLAGYYRKYIRDFSTIAAPLTRLLHRDAFTRDEEATTAFQALKTSLTSGPVLQMSDFNKCFTVDCDASSVGFGAILHQGAVPLAFFSKPFAPRHMKLAAYERELIGLVQAVRHWRPYLWGHYFRVRTDHYSLKFLLDQ
jgi:hypothetical protein